MPPTLAVAAVARVSDVKTVVTKDFKRAGNSLLLVGRFDPEALGGSVYADSFGQRGDRLFDAYDAAAIRVLWDALLGLHARGDYVSGSAIAEGGVFLRLFEGALGSGLGAQVQLDAVSGRRDGLLFGEFVGSVLIEVPPHFDADKQLQAIPHLLIGHILPESKLRLVEGGETVWEESIATLEEDWSKTFREVMK